MQARVTELHKLLAMDPEQYASRYHTSSQEDSSSGLVWHAAVAADPGVLLMDEPFGALDSEARRLTTGAQKIHRATGKTILFVT